MEDILKKFLDNNKKWVASKLRKDSQYFKKFSTGQHPGVLLLGCSDSRVSPSQVLGAELGEIFVHRNIANMAVHSDLNFLSTLQYALEVLKVEHIIVYGHYGCGGVKAAMENSAKGLIDNWLSNIRDIIRLNKTTLDKIKDDDDKFRRLVELNVKEQVFNIKETSIYKEALIKGNAPSLHGWVYDFEEGRVQVLDLEPEKAPVNQLHKNN